MIYRQHDHFFCSSSHTQQKKLPVPSSLLPTTTAHHTDTPASASADNISTKMKKCVGAELENMMIYEYTNRLLLWWCWCCGGLVGPKKQCLSSRRRALRWFGRLALLYNPRQPPGALALNYCFSHRRGDCAGCCGILIFWLFLLWSSLLRSLLFFFTSLL